MDRAKTLTKASRTKRVLLAGAIALGVVIILIAVGQVVLPGLWAKWFADTTSGTGIVYSVADGDTVTLVVDGEKVKIRLLGIDSPEVAHGANPAGCGGEEAKAALVVMLPKGTQVAYVTDGVADQVDRYGRVLAYVSTADVADVGLAMIDQGHAEAWVPAGEPHPDRWSAYVKAQEKAQKNSVGSWANCDHLGR